jgi:hypothetical protein
VSAPLRVRPGRTAERALTARVAIGGVLLLGACAPANIARTAPAAVTPPLPRFIRQPDKQPTVSSGRAGWPIVAFDPDIYVDDEGYHLFYTTLFCRQASGYSYSWDPSNLAGCDILHVVGSIAYAFSNDQGLTWQFRRTPVVMPSDTGFDSAKIETAYVFRLGDTLYLTYSADGDRGGRKLKSRYQIGVAKLVLGRRSVREALSSDSTRFNRRSTPLLPFDLRGGRFDNNVQEPSVVVTPDGIFLYYIALGLRLPEESVEAPGQQITSVGLARAVLDRDLRVRSRSASSLLDGVNITEVDYYDGIYHLFSTTSGSGEFHKGERLSYSTSGDGVHWSPPVPLLHDSIAGLDEWGMMAPTVAVGEDRLLLFYTAYTAEPHACFPVPPNGRFGLPVAGGSECLFATVGRAVAARQK